MISLKNAKLAVPNSISLEDVSVFVPNGKCVALVGPEDSAKHALMEAMAGILRVSPANARRVSGKPEAPACYWGDVEDIYDDPTCQAFLRSANRAAGMERERYVELREMTGLSDEQLKLKLSKCSVEDRLKVKVCAILAGKPANIILASPLEGIGQEGAGWLVSVVAKLKEAGCAVLVSTESLREARLFADTVVFFSGKILGNCPAEATIPGGGKASLTVDNRARALVVLHECGFEAEYDSSGGVEVYESCVRTIKSVLYKSGLPVRKVTQV